MLIKIVYKRIVKSQLFNMVVILNELVNEGKSYIQEANCKLRSEHNQIGIGAGLFKFTYQNNRQTRVDVVCIGFLDFL